MKIGRILKGIGGFYYIYCDGQTYEAKATALFRKDKIKLAVGDFVEFTINDDNTAYIKGLIERKNIFIRPPVSNVDEVLIVASVDKPKFNYQLVDRMILLSRYNGVEPIIIITKSDLDEAGAQKIQEDYFKAGFKVLITSLKDTNSINYIKEHISKKTIMLMGASGVGKSTLISELTDHILETGNISEKTCRGKHTTRHVELLYYNDSSYIVDTPGFSSLAIDFIEDVNHLVNLYTEYKNYSCKFSNCVHINEPKCGVKDAVQEGDIEEFRYENYKYFHLEIKDRR